MTERVATTAGLFALPDWAKTELADLKGHQKGDLVDGDESDRVTEAYDRARREVLELQADADLDRVVEGQLRWDDMLAHPLAVHDSVETRGIVRYYDNNNFYREPVVTGALDADGDLAADLEAARGATDRPLQAVLPGPYSLADLATDDYYGDEAEFLAGVAEFLADELAAAPPVETVFLLEPSLTRSPPGEAVDERASEAIDAVATGTDADVVVQTYWGGLDERVHAHLLDADVDAIGYDLVTAHEQSRYLVSEYGTADAVALGVVDGQNTRLEDPETIRERVAWFQDGLPVTDFERIYLTPNTELFYLPTSTLAEKLAALGEAATAREVRA